MSFVSIVARENYVNIVCDGRVSSGESVIQENYKKFKIIDDRMFIAFGGNLQPCELLLKWISLQNLSNQSLEEIARNIWAVGYSITQKGYKFMVSFGGVEKNTSARIEVYSMDFQSKKPLIFKPRGNDICYSFLNNSELSDKDIEKNFIELMNNTGHDSFEKIKSAQIMLSKKIAETDLSVNTKTFETTIFKTKYMQDTR